MELVDIRDLKSLDLWSCGFKSRSVYHLYFCLGVKLSTQISRLSQAK